MTRSGRLLGGVLGLALLLLAGRTGAAWYVDFLWHEALGTGTVWRAEAGNLLLLRGGAFLVGTLFAGANLLAVRRSVVSLVLPRRVGNLDIGEEVPARVLDGTAWGLAILVGAGLAWVVSDWTLLEAARIAEPVRETDPYFQSDLAAWTSWLPLEFEAHAWALLAHLVVTTLVFALYAATPSVRWDGGRLRVTAHVRRHFFALAALLLLLLAWSYRLDAQRLVIGTEAPFDEVAHRVRLPGQLFLALATVAGAVLLLWTGWVGQLRLAFATVTAMLVLTLLLRPLAPALATLVAARADAGRAASYETARRAYTRHAFALDRVVLPSPGPTRAPGIPAWDARALAGAAVRERRGGGGPVAIGWRVVADGLEAVRLDGPAAADAAAGPWRVVRWRADQAEDAGRTSATTGEEALPPVVVADSARGYRLLRDAPSVVAAPLLTGAWRRIAFAWALQNSRFLRPHPAAREERVLLLPGVRERVRAVLPFFEVGDEVAALAWRDSLTWAVHVYATASTYPLSHAVPFGRGTVNAVRHAGVALVNAHTGRVAVVASRDPDAATRAWMRRFPALFLARSAIDDALLAALAPPGEYLRLMATLHGRMGRRDPAARTLVPAWAEGADSLLVASPLPFGATAARRLGLAVPLVDADGWWAGTVVATGGLDIDWEWHPNRSPAPRWPLVVSRLATALDAEGAMPGGATIRGAVQVVPDSGGMSVVQRAYADAGGRLGVQAVARWHDDSVTVAPTLGALWGPAPPMGGPLPAGVRVQAGALFRAMREALQRGDWARFGEALAALERLLGAAPAQP